MVFEWLSNGTLAELPRVSVPEAVSIPSSPFVLLLLPRNRYLMGVADQEDSQVRERWVWGKPGDRLQEIFLYDGEGLSLPIPYGLADTLALSSETVARLKRELLSQLDPPGNHLQTVLVMRGFMKERFAQIAGNFQDEEVFAQVLAQDETLRKVYWTLRFALLRGDLDEVVRMKAWLKAGPGLLAARESKIWFSLTETPGDDTVKELEALSFSQEDLRHVMKQGISPLILYNPHSGYLVLARFGKGPHAEATNFFVWAFLPSSLWGELRERQKLSVHELLLALWGQYSVERALDERSRYRG